MFRDECRRIVPAWRQIFQARHDEIYAARGVITQLRLYPHYRSTRVTRGSGNRPEIYKRLRGP